MKQIHVLSILLLFLVFNFPFIFAETESDWDNVGEMSQEEFRDNLAEDPMGGFNSAPDRAWQTMESEPQLMENENVADAAFTRDANTASNIINNEPGLLDNGHVFDQFDESAKQDISVLNDNEEAKEKWFSEHGIDDEGAELENYDGSTVETKGDKATTFNVEDHPGATVTEEGELILEDGAEISDAYVTKDDDGTVNVDGGQADLTDSENEDIQVTGGGDVKLGDKWYSSQSPMDVNVEDGTPTIGGDGVQEKTDPGDEGTTLSIFDGEVTLENGYKTLGEGTDYTTFDEEGNKKRNFKVGKDFELHTDPDSDISSCNSANCLVDSEYRRLTFDNNDIDHEDVDHLTVFGGDDLDITNYDELDEASFFLNDLAHANFDNEGELGTLYRDGAYGTGFLDYSEESNEFLLRDTAGDTKSKGDPSDLDTNIVDAATNLVANGDDIDGSDLVHAVDQAVNGDDLISNMMPSSVLGLVDEVDYVDDVHIDPEYMTPEDSLLEVTGSFSDLHYRFSSTVTGDDIQIGGTYENDDLLLSAMHQGDQTHGQIDYDNLGFTISDRSGQTDMQGEYNYDDLTLRLGQQGGQWQTEAEYDYDEHWDLSVLYGENHQQGHVQYNFCSGCSLGATMGQSGDEIYGNLGLEVDL